MTGMSNKQPNTDDQVWNPQLARWQKEMGHVFAATTEVWASGSDRACVLVSVALLDNALEMLLRHTFIATSGATKKECDFLLTKRPIPPLGSAAIRAKLAFAIGSLPKEIEKPALSAIEIRNRFAHSIVTPELDDEIVGSLYDKIPTDLRQLIDGIIGVFPGGRCPRNLFVLSCVYLQQRIIHKADELGDKVPGERQPTNKGNT
jgi:hypothetical protein